jgi:hypothetical protein
MTERQPNLDEQMKRSIEQFDLLAASLGRALVEAGVVLQQGVINFAKAYQAAVEDYNRRVAELRPGSGVQTGATDGNG